MTELVFRLGCWAMGFVLFACAATPWRDNAFGSKVQIQHYSWFAWMPLSSFRSITPIAFTVSAIGLVLVGVGLGILIKSFLP